MTTQIGGKNCYIYDCGSSDVLLIQPVDDHDIEAYYDDHRDEYDDYDEAYEGFMDDEDAWDDY